MIICGYGRCGQNLARMLEREGIPYIALDLDPDRVRQAAAAGDSVVFGDAARLQALVAAGLARASAVVVTYLDVPGALKVLANARSHAPQVPVIVRTQDDRDLEALQAAGATEVVPEALEGSLMLASHALALVGVPMRRVIRIVQDQRDARYSLLRGYFHGADDDTVDELENERLSTVTLPSGAGSLGRALSQLSLQALGVRVVSLRRSTGKTLDPDTDPALAGRRHAGAVGPARNAGHGRGKAAGRQGLAQRLHAGNARGRSVQVAVLAAAQGGRRARPAARCLRTRSAACSFAGRAWPNRRSRVALAPCAASLHSRRSGVVPDMAAAAAALAVPADSARLNASTSAGRIGS